MKNKRKSNFFVKIIVLCMLIAAGFLIFNYFNKTKKSESSNSNTYAKADQIKEDCTENVAIAVSTNSIENTDSKREEKIQKHGKLSSDGLPVLMYHFFYDKSLGETPKDGNYLEISTFEGHLKYLTDNEFYFPSWEEVSKYLDKEIELPAKSIVLSVDDGEDSFFRLAYPVIQKYDVKVTEFLVGAWNGWYKNDYPARQMVYQSHSYDMHKAGADGKGAIMTLGYNKIIEDLTKSKNELGKDECIVFCYPFGHYNENAKKALKDAGFKLAFTTEYGRIKRGMDKLALPRIRTSSSTSVEVLKSLVE